ncbi:hypothetical protein BKA66DRAFT_471455 [Pyrenochaeta sp. MPI-SDFR-AT-0127]|nr:hypothetical protein BKA66DRAFT_471455 [Pyrenochaeta sp. MPI-SDFR-AT-0127]
MARQLAWLLVKRAPTAVLGTGHDGRCLSLSRSLLLCGSSCPTTGGGISRRPVFVPLTLDSGAAVKEQTMHIFDLLFFRSEPLRSVSSSAR